MAAQNLILAFEAVDITTRLAALHLSQDVAVQTAKLIIDVLVSTFALASTTFPSPLQLPSIGATTSVCPS